MTWRARRCRSILRCSRPCGARARSKRSSHDYEKALPAGAWPNWVLGNHDRPRVASRVGPEQARVAAMLLLTLRGTPTLYYGDEIGMRQVPIAPEQVRDPFEKNVPGIGVGRDGCRTPMQWDASAHAGFSTAKPWLPLAHDASHENVVNLDGGQASILSLYKALIALRQKAAGTGHRRLPAGRRARRHSALSPEKRSGRGGGRAQSRCRARFGRPRVRSASASRSCCRHSSIGRARRSRACLICAAMRA